MHPSHFKPLTRAEQEEFRAWARLHFAPGDEIRRIWHPIVQEECARINVRAWETSHQETPTDATRP